MTTATIEPALPPHATVTAEEWVHGACTLVVAGVAAYARSSISVVTPGRWFRFGRRGVAAVSVDGLLVLATVGVLTSSQQVSRRYRIAVWVSFWAGIAMSLTANISTAPTLTLQPILVAGWPPVALLLAVELLGLWAAHRDRPGHARDRASRGRDGGGWHRDRNGHSDGGSGQRDGR